MFFQATEKQRVQLEKLSKDPAKPAFIPAPPQDKTLRPAREMMKNVQGSSAGAGSGEFHVYKAGRRREYERLKMFEETSAKVCLPARALHILSDALFAGRERSRIRTTETRSRDGGGQQNSQESSETAKEEGSTREAESIFR